MQNVTSSSNWSSKCLHMSSKQSNKMFCFHISTIIYPPKCFIKVSYYFHMKMHNWMVTLNQGFCVVFHSIWFWKIILSIISLQWILWSWVQLNQNLLLANFCAHLTLIVIPRLNSFTSESMITSWTNIRRLKDIELSSFYCYKH